jgi:hypothetical protein
MDARLVAVHRERVDLRRAVVVQEDSRREGVEAAPYERRRHRRACVGERLDRREIEVGAEWMRDEVMEERRRKVERGQALGLDQREGALGVPARLADEAAGDDRHREQRVHAHRVVERHDAERAVARAETVLERLRDGAGAIGGVRARDALRPTGRAGRVEHQARRAAVDVGRRRDGAVLEELGEARVADHDEAVLVARHETRAGVVEAVVDVVSGRAPGERDEDRARPLRRPVELDRLVAVVEHGREPVASPEAELGEAAREPRRTFTQLRVRETQLAVDDGVALACACGGAFEHGGEVHASAAVRIASTIGS